MRQRNGKNRYGAASIVCEARSGAGRGGGTRARERGAAGDRGLGSGARRGNGGAGPGREGAARGTGGAWPGARGGAREAHGRRARDQPSTRERVMSSTASR